jgi:hypothetical protein
MTSSRNTNVVPVPGVSPSAERHEAGQHAGHLDPRELGAAAMAHAHREVHAQVRDIRERMAGIEGERREDGEDLRLEVLREPRVDCRRVVGRLEEADPVRGQERAKVLRPARCLLVHLGQRTRADDAELVLGGKPVERGLFDAGPELLEDRGDPDHEELVQVGAGDCEELDALEQRVREVLGLGQHPPVELQPAQFSIDVQRRCAQVGRVEP